MSERKAGWYWIKLGDCPWEAAHWTGEDWDVVGSDDPLPHYESPVVGHRIPTPDEPWQCVPNILNNEMVKAFSLETVGRWDDATEAERVEVAEKLQSAFDAMLSAAPKPEDAE